MRTPRTFHEKARFIRWAAGPIGFEKTLRKALRVLARHDIPHLVFGGYACQELGYPRYTGDLDIIVPDVPFAYEKLALNGFIESPIPEVRSFPKGSDPDTNSKWLACHRYDRHKQPPIEGRMVLMDEESEIDIDLFPGGVKIGTAPVPMPVPTKVSRRPQLMTLQGLISLKLSSYIGSGIRRIQDYSDVTMLMMANHLPREFGVDEQVKELYRMTWDRLAEDERKV